MFRSVESPRPGILGTPIANPPFLPPPVSGPLGTPEKVTSGVMEGFLHSRARQGSQWLCRKVVQVQASRGTLPTLPLACIVCVCSLTHFLPAWEVAHLSPLFFPHKACS